MRCSNTDGGRKDHHMNSTNPPTTDAPADVPADADRSYPISVHAGRDGPLSRWLWLVKWLLVVPHVLC
jgi:hypothetical protein